MEVDPTVKDPVETDDELVHVDNESDVEVNDVTADQQSVGAAPAPTSTAATRPEVCKCPEQTEASCNDTTCARNHTKVPRNTCSTSRHGKDKRKHSSRSDGGRSEGGRSDSSRSDGGRSDGGRSDSGRSDSGRNDAGRATSLKNLPGTESVDEGARASSKTGRRHRPEEPHRRSEDAHSTAAAGPETERRKVIVNNHPQSLSQALSYGQASTPKGPELDCHPENLSASAKNSPGIPSPQTGTPTLPQADSPHLKASSDFYHSSAFSRQTLASPELGHLMPQSARDLPPRPVQYLPPTSAMLPENLSLGSSTPREQHSLPECQRFLQGMGQISHLLSRTGDSKDALDKAPPSSVSSASLSQPAHRPSFMISDILGDRQPSKESPSKEPISREPFSREPFSREPTSREPFSREPFSREPFSKEPPSRIEPSSRDPPSGPRSSLTYFPAVRYAPLRLLSPHSPPGLDRSPGSEDAPSCSQSPMEEEEEEEEGEGSDLDVGSEYHIDA